LRRLLELRHRGWPRLWRWPWLLVLLLLLGRLLRRLCLRPWL